MLKSEIEKILKETIVGNEELRGIEEKFHAIEREIDGMANKPEADLSKIIDRAKVLIVRIFDNFQGSSAWIKSKWKEIEKKVRENLKELE